MPNRRRCTAGRLNGVAAACFGVLVASTTHGQEHVGIDSWSVEDGLPQGSVNDVLQTQDGYLWLATFGGLVRFDGVRFVVFDRSVDGVDSLRVRTLYEDRTGTLWAATDDGAVLRYRDGAFRTFDADDGLPHSGALRIEEDEAGRIWVVWVDAVTRIEGSRFTTLQPGDIARDLRIGGPDHYRRTSVWWRSDADGLQCLIAGRLRTCVSRDLVPAGEILAVTAGPDVVWVHTATAIYQVSAGRRSLVKAPPGPPPGYPYRDPLLDDGRGTLWYAHGLHLYRITGEQHVRLPIFNPLVVYQDREGSVWIGSVRGLHRVRPQAVRRLTVGEGLSSDNVYSILATRSADVWIGTWSGGLNRLTGGQVRIYGVESGLLSDRITAVHEDGGGRLWVGTTGGLTYLADGRFERYVAPEGLLDGNVWSIQEDTTGSLWFATDRGLVRQRGGTFRRFTTAEGLPHDAIGALLSARDGTLWIGTRAGLARLRGDVFTAYTARDGFVGNQVRALHEDGDGLLWVGTYDGGLYRLDAAGLTRYTTRAGLHDNGVFHILEDDDGHFWLTSNRGISRVSRRALNAFAAGRISSVQALILGLRDGLAMLECNGGRQPGGQKMVDGTLWFPTQGGVAIVDPAVVRTDAITPPAIVEGFDLQGRPVAFRSGVEAAADQNSFEIRYTAPSFVRPDQIRFRYRLGGLDDDWIEAGSRRVATYYRVPPGRYQFEVTAAGSNGAWTGRTDRVAVVVLAPVWRRSWFLGLCAIGLLVLAAFGGRRRVAARLREQDRQRAFARQLIETQEQERRRISNDLHDSLGQTLSLIRGLARAADGAPGETCETIATLAGKAHADLKEIAYDLRPYQLDRLGITRTIEGLVARLDGSCGIRFDHDLAAIDHLVAPAAAIGIYRIVQEGLNNVIRHSGATRATVGIRRDGRVVEIEIADNGRGFPPGQDRAARGFGLMGMEERARSLGGWLTLRSSPGRGTTVSVRFPHEGASDA